jgi:hypothetical protein
VQASIKTKNPDSESGFFFSGIIFSGSIKKVAYESTESYNQG